MQEQGKCFQKQQHKKLTGYNEWFGDEMVTSNTWPKHTRGERIIQIFGQNVNGVSHFDKYAEWKIILETLHNQQNDVVCLTELNLDVNKPEVKYELT